MTEDLQRTIDRLSQQLRDERRLRDAAERKAATQAEHARTWRERAEERTARIDRLVEERERLRRWPNKIKFALGAFRSSSSPEGAPERSEGGSTDAATPRRRPGLPNVQAAHLVAGPDLRRVAGEFTGHDLGEGDEGFFEADVVLVEAEALARASSEARGAFEDWVALEARQPLLWVGEARELPGPTTVIAPGAPELITFDPARHTPVGRSGRPEQDRGPAPPAGSREWVEQAAQARQFREDADPVRAADLRRRQVWADRHPRSVAVALLQRAGVSFERPTPEAAAVLVSNRPDDLRRQILAVPSQAHRPLRLQVGCHGFSSSDVAEELRQVDGDVPVEVLDLPEGRPLGWCLNRMIEGVGAPVLAKIDDDDHYGPGYLVDAIQALEYAQAAIVGRVGSFTYLEGQDETVLRRVGDEERHYDGTLVGATMVFRRSAWERSPFAHKTLAEDVSFQRGVMSLGETMYAASRWDFVYRRRMQGNTWRAPDEHFLANADPAWDGWEPRRADLEPRG